MASESSEPLESSAMTSESSAMASETYPSDIWVADSGAPNHVVPLDISCFTTYSTDVPYSTVKGINGNTKVIGIGNVNLTSSNGGELIVKDALHAPGLPYSLLSLGQLLLDDAIITFEKPYCIIEKNGFYMKAKFSQSFGTTSFLFRFRVTFPSAMVESNYAATNSNPAISDLTED